MYHEGLRRRLSHSADQRRRREERASNWLFVLGSTWAGVVVSLICPLPALSWRFISGSSISVIFGVLLILGCAIDGRFK